MECDPWSIRSSRTHDNHPISTFEDNFHCPLPDSQEYLARLERKLERISKGKGSNKKELLEYLEEKKRDVVDRLLTEDSHSVEYFQEIDIPRTWLKNYINPEQPLSADELYNLVKEDYLAKASEEIDSKACFLIIAIFFFIYKTMTVWTKEGLCLVTGASQGIGREIAKQFAEKMAPNSTLLLSARSENGLEETRAIIKTSAPQINVEILPYNMCDANISDFSRMLKKHALTEKNVYMLVHNAGTEGSGRMIKDCSNPEEWQSYLQLNFVSMTALNSAFFNTFKYPEKTVVINITSLAALQPFSALGEYCVGKAAREMYLRCLSEENPSLRILSYSPGPVKTEMIDRVISKVSSSETKNSFEKMRDEKILVNVEDTVGRLVKLVTNGLPKYSRVDYFDTT